MKKVIVFLLASFVLNATYAQTFLQVKFSHRSKQAIDTTKSKPTTDSLKKGAKPALTDTTKKIVPPTTDANAATQTASTCNLDTVANIKFIKQDDDYFLGIFVDGDGNALESFTIIQLNEALFYDKLKAALKTLCDNDKAIDDKTNYLKDTVKLYTQFLEAKENLANTNGLAGVLTIHKTINIYNDTTVKDSSDNKDDFKIVGKFTIQEIQIQFQDGLIENVKVIGLADSDKVNLRKYENRYPIGFSTKRNYRHLVDALLYYKKDDKTKKEFFLKLGEVISYNENFANENKDYSPANQVLTVQEISKDTKEVPLYKEQTSKILEAKIYSDIKGADADNPNGLIQVELSKKLNFWSNRYPTAFGNIGFFNYITPQFALNKVEDNQKYLILNHIDTLTLAADTSKSITYTSTINLLKHQLYNVGFDITALTLDVPGIKSTFCFGAGFHFGRTAVQDTLRIKDPVPATNPNFLHFTAAPTNNVLQYGINTFQWGPFFTWQIFPDTRFGVSATQRFTWFHSNNSNFVQVRDSADYLRFIAQTPKAQIGQTPYEFKKCIASSEIYAYFCPNSDGANKLFFRYRFNWDFKNVKENYQQLQIGFSTYITATKEFTKLKKNAGNIF